MAVLDITCTHSHVFTQCMDSDILTHVLRLLIGPYCKTHPSIIVLCLSVSKMVYAMIVMYILSFVKGYLTYV